MESEKGRLFTASKALRGAAKRPCCRALSRKIFSSLRWGFFSSTSRSARETERLEVVKESTRQELYRRLLKGRDHLHSSQNPPSLNDAARAACLSPYHFHRGFKQAFGKTPHQYVTSVRLERALGMLKANSTVLEACLATGFQSPSAFTRLFRSHFGQAPSAFRCKIRKIGQEFA